MSENEYLNFRSEEIIICHTLQKNKQLNCLKGQRAKDILHFPSIIFSFKIFATTLLSSHYIYLSDKPNYFICTAENLNLEQLN